MSVTYSFRRQRKDLAWAGFITTARLSDGKAWLQLGGACASGVPLAGFELIPRYLHRDALNRDLLLASLLSAEAVESWKINRPCRAAGDDNV